MKRATCIRGALLMVLLALTSFATSAPPASAFPDCADPSYPATCCRCVNRCNTLYDRCIAATPTQEGACFAEWLACNDSCYNGLTCGA